MYLNDYSVRKVLNQVCAHSWQRPTGCMSDLLKMLSVRCVCLFVCLSTPTLVRQSSFLAKLCLY